jgi:3-phenylpropionate/trans-cinnamate dioxygenase ferredoxin subunit
MTIDLGSLELFDDGEATRVQIGESWAVVVRIGDDVFALEDRCSHEEFRLSDGLVDAGSCEIECARHGAMFSLHDGAPLSLPATKPVATFALRIEDGRVLADAS